MTQLQSLLIKKEEKYQTHFRGMENPRVNNDNKNNGNQDKQVHETDAWAAIPIINGLKNFKHRYPKLGQMQI